MIWIAPLGLLIHELGHAVAALLFKGQAVMNLGVGTPVLKLRFKRLTLRIGLFFMLGGFTTSESSVGFKKWQEAAISIGGPLFNGIVFMILYKFVDIGKDGSIHTFMLFNLYLAVFNCIPIKFKERKSDGYRFMKAFFKTDSN
nr:M50 family metallopeptidase [Thalassobacillus pellis]